MRADHVSEGDVGEKLVCDLCNKSVEEWYSITPEKDKEWNVLQKEFNKDPTQITVCEDCLYEKFSSQTQIYSCSGKRMIECEVNLKGNIP